MEGKGGFQEKGWKEARSALLPASERQKIEKKKANGVGKSGSRQNTVTSRKPSGSKNSAWQQSGNRQEWTSLVKFLEREGLMPTVVFSFSKKVRFSSIKHVSFIYLCS